MKVHLQGQTISSLSDGYVGRLLDSALDQIVRDIDDRGEDQQIRKLTLEISFKPQTNGLCKIMPTVCVKVPKLVPPETIAKLDKNAGAFAFNPDLAENPEQSTFADLPPK